MGYGQSRATLRMFIYYSFNLVKTDDKIANINVIKRGNPAN